MCRNIRTLHNFEPPLPTDEIRAAAPRTSRKVAGTTKPIGGDREALETAIDAVVAATSQLLEDLTTSAPPKDRDVEAAKAKARSALRYSAAG
jgi:hypothetical protein